MSLDANCSNDFDLLSYTINTARELSLLLKALERGKLTEKEKLILIAKREYGDEILHPYGK